MTEILLGLMKMNLAAAAAVALVLALRLPVRRWLGPRLAYGLWALPALAALAMLAPRRVITVVLPAADASDPAATAFRITDAMAGLGPGALRLLPMDFDPAGPLAALWIAGAMCGLLLLVRRQARFARAAREGLAGPAVVGVVRPRIVTPTDFADRYTDREQLVVLAHEAAHICRQDSRVNAAVALACCLNWFNPLMHLMARYLRVDQELACDAQVAAWHPGALRSYAEAMLKAQLAVRPLPIGCYWPAPAAHPLAERIRLLTRAAPGPATRRLGGAAVSLAVLGLAWSAWAVQPAKVLWVTPAETAPGADPNLPALAAANARTVIPREAAAAPTEQATPPSSASAASPPPAPDLHAAGNPPANLLEVAERAFSALAAPPERKIYAVARRSAVQPGFAVRVLAEMTDPEGARLTTDLTAYGSQQRYRTGYFRRQGSHQALFTAVTQNGDRFTVTASLDRRFSPETSGSIVLRSGETGTIHLANGQTVTVTPMARAESPEEMAEGQQDRRDGPWAF